MPDLSKIIGARWKIVVEVRLARAAHLHESGFFEVPLEKVIRRPLRIIYEFLIKIAGSNRTEWDLFEPDYLVVIL